MAILNHNNDNTKGLVSRAITTFTKKAMTIHQTSLTSNMNAFAVGHGGRRAGVG